MSATAKLSIMLNSRRVAASIARSLSPETNHSAGSKSRVRISVGQKKLELTFIARDATALRAIMNSYLRMIRACLRVTEAIENIT